MNCTDKQQNVFFLNCTYFLIKFKSSQTKAFLSFLLLLYNMSMVPTGTSRNNKLCKASIFCSHINWLSFMLILFLKGYKLFYLNYNYISYYQCLCIKTWEHFHHSKRQPSSLVWSLPYQIRHHYKRIMMHFSIQVQIEATFECTTCRWCLVQQSKHHLG